MKIEMSKQQLIQLIESYKNYSIWANQVADLFGPEWDRDNALADWFWDLWKARYIDYADDCLWDFIDTGCVEWYDNSNIRHRIINAVDLVDFLEKYCLKREE